MSACLNSESPGARTGPRGTGIPTLGPMSQPLPPPHSVATAVCSGEVHDPGAQVTGWAPAGAAPVLYASTAVRLERGRPIRAGIPVCWPWFGPGRSGDLEPPHGFVRTAQWELVEETTTAAEAVFVHRLSHPMAGSPHWPYRYAVQLRSRLGPDLEVSLTTTNLAEEPVDYEEALHAYLVVGDIREARISGLDGMSFYDKVTRTRATHGGDLAFSGETDAVFRTADPVTVHDPVLGRRLVVTTQGASNVVIWNPWDAKAKEAEDIGDDDWTGFVCVEGANVLDDAVILGPGDSHTMTYHLSVETL
jgi:glucose-6-phosphate 1-epimerase